MNRIRPDVDIILDLLKNVLDEQPSSIFIKSLLEQYQERGGLSKKQLQGLYGKASRIKSIPPGKLATLEAILLKKPTRFKSTLPTPEPLYKKDQEAGKMITAILEKYPAHKRVLYLKSRYENNEPLSAAEMGELQKFSKLLS
ncbi:MAG TPA: hypothetical protein VFO70_03930 [Chitinophagaceae bacterium]|nr:hypothetical protein [Chitinophagaceae bacterium]